MTSIYLNEDAYYRVLKAFAAGSYDLKKEMLLARLRRELLISDERHGLLRAMIEDGRELRERDYPETKPTALPRHQHGNGMPKARRMNKPSQAKPQQVLRSSDEEDYVRGVNRALPPDSPFVATERYLQSQEDGIEASEGHPAKRPKRQEGAAVDRLHTAGRPHPADINELIGYKIRRWWPENGGWFEGAITDYRAATGEHCIVYDMNTSQESYEWFDMSISRDDEFKIMGERINIIEHAPQRRIEASRPPAATYSQGMQEMRGFMHGRGRGQPGHRLQPSQVGSSGQRALNLTGARKPFHAEPTESNSSLDSLSD